MIHACTDECVICLARAGVPIALKFLKEEQEIIDVFKREFNQVKLLREELASAHEVLRRIRNICESGPMHLTPDDLRAHGYEAALLAQIEAEKKA